jgi:hypothetical protein
LLTARGNTSRKRDCVTSVRLSVGKSADMPLFVDTVSKERFFLGSF